jgi:hypothetical protein
MRSKSLLPVLTLLFAGCASFGSGSFQHKSRATPGAGEKVGVTVTAVTMEAFSKRAVGGQLEMTVANPSQQVMSLRYIDWELAVGGEAVTGRTEVSGQLPAEGSAPVSAALEVLAADAERVVPQLDEGLRDYQLRGVLHYETTAHGRVAHKTVGFEAAGVL